ncbi:MAG: spoIiaa [Proteobacteria bacterium]|jgi:anti-anti-sigma factor|nr:spoIiaa [Pseudomonadota bacterium]
MSSALRIAVSEEKGNVPVTILHLTGDLDGKTYQELEAKAAEIIGAGASNLLFDLGGVGFMGSAGMRALHAISNKMKTAGPNGSAGKMTLLNPTDAVARVLKTLGFDQHFSIHTNLEEALKSF